MLIVKALCSSGPPAGCRRIRYRATAARATSHKTAGRIVFPTQSFGDTLAVHGRMFRARRVEQIHADGLAGLRLPILAALMFGKTQPLIGACSYASIPTPDCLCKFAGFSSHWINREKLASFCHLQLEIVLALF